MAPLGPPPPPGYMPPAAAAVPPMALDSDKPPKGGRYGVVGTAGFIGNFILLSIPIIGLIFIFIWAFSKKVNMNRRNMARAMLILGLIGIALAAIVGVLFATIFNGFFDSALDELIRLFQSFSA